MAKTVNYETMSYRQTLSPSELVAFYSRKLEEALTLQYGGDWVSKVVSGEVSVLFVKN